MSHIIPPKLVWQLRLTLDNLSLANLICTFLLDQHKRGFAPIPTDVWMRGNGSKVHIPGENCGFFTTPIIHNASLDIRRSLEFMMLRIDRTTGTLISFTNKKWPDDFSITELGVKAPSPEQFYELSMKSTGKAPRGFLGELVDHASKELAHFSTKNEQPDMMSIIDATVVMKEALLVFVYDAMKLPRPKIQPGTIEPN